MINPNLAQDSCLCMCVQYACMCVHDAETKGRHWVSSSTAPQFIFWGKVSHLNPDITNLASLASRHAPWILYLLLPNPVISGKPLCVPGIFVSAKGLNSSALCATSALPTNPPPILDQWTLTLIDH